MKLNINDDSYDVIITYKNIKNMYLRVKSDLKIYITCSKYAKEKDIVRFIESNTLKINEIINDIKRKNINLSDKIMYLGNSYDKRLINTKEIIFGKDYVFIGKNFNLDKFYKIEASRVFKERLDYIYKLFEEDISYPSLRIRKMTSKWGVCNITRKIVTLNLELIKLDIKYLDYVIVHELSHLIYPNHSKDFWNLVYKYCPNYKIYRKEMKNLI